MSKYKKLKWAPKPGIYQCVIPNGTVHIDIFIEGRNAEPLSLGPGEEVELYDKEIRPLRKSEILQEGYLAPLFFFDKDEDGNKIEVEAKEDEENPNIINDDQILLRVQSFDSSEEFAVHLSKITSMLTINRFRRACEVLDTPQSFLSVVDSRLDNMSDVEMKQMYAGPIDSRREAFLSAKIDKE